MYSDNAHGSRETQVVKSYFPLLLSELYLPIGASYAS